MRYASTALGACCVAVILMSVIPVAAQKPVTGVTQHQLDGRAPIVMSTRFPIVPTSAPQEMWSLGVESPLMGSWEAAPHARREVREVQLVSGQTVRSKTRTGIGGALMLAGFAGIYFGYFLCEVGGADAEHFTWDYVGPAESNVRGFGPDGCVLDPHPDWSYDDVYVNHAPNYSVVGAGGGVFALGLLLTTVWSDVEVRQSQSGVEVGVSLGSR